jgi:hypothetical protein
MLRITADSDFSSNKVDCTLSGNNCNNNEEPELNEDLEWVLDETQHMLSLETADNIDLEMDVDLLIHADPLDEGVEMDVSEGEGMGGLV